MKENKFIEKTLVLIKPDAVARGISGQILTRFERVGLKIVGLKIIYPTKEMLDVHFPIADEAWIRGMGEKTFENYKENDLDPITEFGTNDSFEMGKKILSWNYDYLLSGPVIAIALKGVRAINVVRKIIGNTIPAKSMPGTIRGDFSINSSDHANLLKSACKNVVHASGNIEEAKKEINVWFEDAEIVDYARSDEQIMF